MQKLDTTTRLLIEWRQGRGVPTRDIPELAGIAPQEPPGGVQNTPEAVRRHLWPSGWLWGLVIVGYLGAGVFSFGVWAGWW